MIVRHTARYGIEVTPDNILITSGSQQALDLLGKILINPGDRILVESPTYLGALQAWTAYGAEYVTVPMDENGMITDALEDALRSGPKFIYVLPNFQNPTGVTLSLERRHKLIELADRYGVPIVEDDPYGQLRYEGEHLPSVVVLDSEFRNSGEACYSGNVIYLSTFSKILAPGLRLAWVIAPPEVIRKLAQAKQGADLHTATFNQCVAYEVARGGFLDRHVLTIREVYGERRDVMLGAMDAYFPPGVEWTHPQGGLFLVGHPARDDQRGGRAEGGDRTEGGICARRAVLCHRPQAQHHAAELLPRQPGKDRRRYRPDGQSAVREDGVAGELLGADSR